MTLRRGRAAARASISCLAGTSIPESLVGAPLRLLARLSTRRIAVDRAQQEGDKLALVVRLAKSPLALDAALANLCSETICTDDYSIRFGLGLASTRALASLQEGYGLACLPHRQGQLLSGSDDALSER